MTQTILTVPDITCAHCERTITNALTPLDGVRRVTVDIPAKEVRVDYDEAAITVDRMRQVLQEEEYPAAAETLVGPVGPHARPVATVAPATATTTATLVRDPVRGMDVDPATTRHTGVYQGQTYSFCSPGCMAAFTADPPRYLGASDGGAACSCSCCH